MILFFEGQKYRRSLLDAVFGADHAGVISRGNLKDDKAVLDCVGYYFDPKHSHVFILPKVFNINGRGFGCLDLNEGGPVEANDVALRVMKDNGWNPDILIDLPLYLYQAIDKYRRREVKNVSTEQDATLNVTTSKKGETEMTLLDVIISLRDFYNANKDLFVLVYKQAHSGFNKVKWGRTIRTEQPVISGEEVIYPHVVNHRKQVNYDEELLVMFFNTLRYINNEYHFRFDVDQPYNLMSDREFKSKLKNGAIGKRLLTIKNNYFNEKFVQLWEMLYRFTSKISSVRKAKENEEYLIARDFNNVFEDMIDVLLGDADAPGNLVKQQDGKIVDHLFKGMSLTTDKRQVYYVGDSKYYKENAAPEGNSLFKQYTYAKNIIQTQLNWYHKKREHLKYRDELTEGYNITPNFFISGRVEKEYGFMSAELHLLDDKKFDKNFQFRNRIFDRDTLFLRMYDINFLFALYAYVCRSQNVRTKFKVEAKEIFRRDFIRYIDEEHDFYLLQQRNERDVKSLVDRHFRELNGKVFCPYEKGEVHYGLMMMGLERNAFDENAKLLAGLSKDFIIKEYHLGTEPYVYYNGLLFGKEVPRVMALRDVMTDDNGNFRRESVLFGCYRSEAHKEWVLKNGLYNVRFNEGRAGAVYQMTQQVFTASFLILYDYFHPEAEACCYLLSGVTELVDVGRMKGMDYPKEDWDGDESYLLYHIEIKVEGYLDVEHILSAHPESRDGRAVYLYFEEVENENQ